MGNMCGADTGAGAGGANEQISFKKTNIYDVDRFFDRATKLLDDLKGVMDPVDADESNLYESSGFVFMPVVGKPSS